MRLIFSNPVSDNKQQIGYLSLVFNDDTLLIDQNQEEYQYKLYA
jgi:hypothetical protein